MASLDDIARALQAADAQAKQADANGDADGAAQHRANAQQLAAAYRQMQGQGQSPGNTAPNPHTLSPESVAADTAAATNTQAQTQGNDLYNQPGVTGLVSNIAEGLGNKVYQAGQGLQQLYGTLFNDPDLVSKVTAQRAADEKATQGLQGTVGGKLGGLGGDIALASIPVGGMEVGGAGLATEGLARPLARALMNPSVQGAVTGALQGASTPTTSDDQSHLENALTSAAWGAGAPAIMSYGPAVLGKMLPGVSAKAALIKSIASRYLSPSADTIAQQASDAAGVIGQRMGNITDTLDKVPISPDVAARVAQIKAGYGNNLDPDAVAALNRMSNASNMGGNLPGEVLAKIRSGALKEAENASGAVENGYFDMQRLADGQIDNHLNSLAPTPQELRFGQTKADQLRLLRAAYGQAKSGVPVNPNAILSRDLPNVAPQGSLGILPLTTTLGLQQQFQQQ